DPELTTARVAEQVRAALEELATMGPEALVAQRYAKFRAMGRLEP
ncbi:MAG: acetyl-CoA carboxylase carboxyl transferase subunit alpha, partial [Nitrospirae bacterium]